VSHEWAIVLDNPTEQFLVVAGSAEWALKRFDRKIGPGQEIVAVVRYDWARANGRVKGHGKTTKGQGQ